MEEGWGQKVNKTRGRKPTEGLGWRSRRDAGSEDCTRKQRQGASQVEVKSGGAEGF